MVTIFYWTGVDNNVSIYKRRRVAVKKTFVMSIMLAIITGWSIGTDAATVRDKHDC